MTRLMIASKRIQAACSQPAALFWLGVVVFVVLAVIGASGGVRGSDQYWYLGDLETLVKGEPHFSNSLFPRQLLKDGLERSPFFHNTLPQYAAIPLAKLFGPFFGWMAMNVIAMILAAYLTWKAALLRGDAWLAAFLGVVMLLLPLSVWHSCQVLAEPALMPMFAAAILVVQRPGGLFRWFVLALVLVLAFMSRFTSLALLLVLPMVVLSEPLRIKRKLLGCFMVVAVIVVGFFLNRWLFGSVPLRDSGVTHGIVTRGMGLWYSSEPVALTTYAIKEKLLYSFGEMMTGTLPNKVMLATNYVLLLLAAGGAAVALRRKVYGFSIFVLSVIALNLATMLLFQNQARYVVPSYPVLLVAASYPLALLVANRRRAFMAVLPLALIILVVAACPTVLHGRKDGLQEKAERTLLETMKQKMLGQGDVISSVESGGQLIAYSLNPRVVLFVSPKSSEPDWDRILSMPRWRWVFCREIETALFARRQVELKVLQRFEFQGEAFGLYELPVIGTSSPRALP